MGSEPGRLRRPGRSSSRRLVWCRKVAPLFYDLPAPEAPTGAAPPILAAMTTRAAGECYSADVSNSTACIMSMSNTPALLMSMSNG